MLPGNNFTDTLSTNSRIDEHSSDHPHLRLLIDEVFRQRKPLLVICRGQQMLNVALGGTLLVDISRQRPTALNHKRMDLKDQVVHEVDIRAGSLLAQIISQPRLAVNSSHHQAVDKVSKVLTANAVSKDKIVEGLELAPAHRHLLPYLLAVQFHPERLWSRYAEHLEIFKSFTRACSRKRGRVRV